MNQIKPDQAATILDAALETILANKISGARLRQVARKAGMSQGNIHYYYPTKDELYKALLDHLLQVFVEDRKSVLSDRTIPPQQKLRYFFDQQIELIRRHKEVVIFFDFWVQGTVDQEIRRKISGMYAKWREDIQLVIDEGIQKGVFSKKAAPQMPAVLASIMDGASLQVLMDGKALDLQAYFQVSFDMVLKMLSA
ncbi:MAG: TetR/AcrR family transcriptional regulator [Anaerolineales bacterium]|jgi:AcrR family transcriptional regulator